MTPCSRLVAVTTTSSSVWATAGPVPTKAAETARGKMSRALGLAPNTFAIVVSSCVQEQSHWVVCSRCFMEALHLEYHLDEYTHDLVQGNP